MIQLADAGQISPQSHGGPEVSSSIHDPSHAVSKKLHVEIEQEPGSKSRQLQVRKQLGTVNLMQTFDRLDLDHDTLSYSKIQPDSRVQLQSLVGDRYHHLPLDLYAPKRDLVPKGRLVHGFEQPRSKNAVHLYCRPYDLVSKVSVPSFYYLRGLCASVFVHHRRIPRESSARNTGDHEPVLIYAGR